MKKEKSCGAVIIKDEKILMVQENKGHWGLPKGHIEENETDIQTAIREVKEETGLDVTLDENRNYEINYIVDEEIDKKVVYFIATSVKGDIVRQESEINQIKWVPISEAVDTITYDNAKEMLRKIFVDLGYIKNR